MWMSLVSFFYGWKRSPVDLNSREPILRGVWRENCSQRRFPDFYTKQARPEDHLCKLFFIEMSEERHEKCERTLPVLWRPWALAYSHDQLCNFSCMSAMSKNCRLRSYFSPVWGLIWRVKAFNGQQYQLLTRNKGLSNENNSNFRTTFECVHIGSILPWAPATSTVDVNSQFSRFQLSAFSSSGFASIMSIFAPILLRLFFSFSSSMKGLKYIVTDFFLISTSKNKLCVVKADRVG